MSIVRNEYPQSVIQKLRFNDYMYHKYDEEKPKVGIMRQMEVMERWKWDMHFYRLDFLEDVNIHDIGSPNFNLQNLKELYG